MPLNLPKKLKTLAQELKEKTQSGTTRQETASMPSLTKMLSLNTSAQAGGETYLQPTNSVAIKELGKLGVDTSKIDKEFFHRNAWLKQYARAGMNGVPLAPDDGSSREEKAAYYYVKLLNAENQTARAETELAGLNREISYWAGRKDRNYSDEEILGRIDWKKYPTLSLMRESKTRGRPVPLNRGVDFDDDAVYGILWSARNGKGSGNHTLDAMKYTLGMGNTFMADPEVRAKLDPNDSAYNPYALGSTVDEAAEYFGVNGFNQKWLNDNLSILKSGNETAKKYYRQVYDAEQVTLLAEEETRKLSERLNTRLKQAVSVGGTIDANALLKDALFGLNTLKRMDEGLVSGDLAKLNRPINYSWQDVVKNVNHQVQNINARQNAPYNPAELDIAARNEEKKVLREQGTLIQNEAIPKSYTAFKEGMPGLWATGLTKNPLTEGWYVPELIGRYSYKAVYKEPNVRPLSEWHIPVITPEQWDGMSEEEKKSFEAQYWATVLAKLQGKNPGELNEEEQKLFDMATDKLHAYYNPKKEKQIDPHSIPPIYKREGYQKQVVEDKPLATPSPLYPPREDETPSPTLTAGPAATPVPTVTSELEKEEKADKTDVVQNIPAAVQQPTARELELGKKYEEYRIQAEALETKLKDGKGEDGDFEKLQEITYEKNCLYVEIENERKREAVRLELEAEKSRVAEAIAPFNTVVVPEGYHTHNKRRYDDFMNVGQVSDDPDIQMPNDIAAGQVEPINRLADLWSSDGGVTAFGKRLMTNDEKSRYMFIYDAMGSDKGEDYLRLLLEWKLNERIARDLAEKSEKYAKSNPAGASLLSIQGNVFAAGYGLAALGRGLLGDTLTEFDPLFIAGNTSSVMRYSVASQLTPTGAFFYNVGMSVVDMLVSRGLTKASGMAELSLFMMAGQSGGSTMSDVLKNGGTMDQALALGLISATLSGTTEKLQMDRFFKMLEKGTIGPGMKELFAGLVRNMFAQGAPEGLENFIEWGGNIIAEYYERKDASQISQMYQANLVACNGDASKAWAATAGQLALEAKDQVLSGALAGAFFGDLATFGIKIRSIAMGDGGKSNFNPGQAKTQAIADSRNAGDFGAAAAQGYDVIMGSGGDISTLSTNEGAVRMTFDLALDAAKAFTPEQIVSPDMQATVARYDSAVNTILGIDPTVVEQIQPQITEVTTVQADVKDQPASTTGLISTIVNMDDGPLNTVVDHVLGDNPSLKTAQTLLSLLQLRNMETGVQTKAFETAEAALKTAAGNRLQSVTVNTGHEDLNDLISIANQSPNYLDIAKKRWGVQGVNYISSLITAGRGDLASAIVALPTYAKSTIIAETNMRAFGLNDAAIAAQENALQADMKSPIVVWNAKQIAKLQAVEARKTELIAGGALGDQSSLIQNVNNTGKIVNQSKAVLDQAVRKEQAGMNTLLKAQAAFHQNMADTAATDALSAAIENLQNARGERRKAEQARNAGQQALNDAQRKLTDAQKQAMAKVTAQAKQDVDAMVRNRAEERNKFKEQDGGEKGEPVTVPSDQTKPYNVSNEGKEGNPLAPSNGSGIIGEGAQGEDASGAGDAGKPGGQTEGIEDDANFENVLTLSTRFLNKMDPMWKNSKNIKPIEGYQDIVCHGDKTGFSYKDLDGNEINLTPREFAEILKNSSVFEGRPVRLISCQSGADGSFTAQYIANQLGVDVLAPTDTVFVYPDGEMVVGPSIKENTGTWKIYSPNRGDRKKGDKDD